jgi:sugar lactone lactonase YvrE
MERPVNAHEVAAAVAVRVWSETPGLLSEGPRWHDEPGQLLWVDILASRFHRASLGPEGELQELATIAVGRHVGAVAPVTSGGYVLAAGRGFLFVNDDGTVRELAQPATDGNVRMNDGGCDRRGRFWAGTMAYDESPGMGALFRLELDGSATTMLTGLTISNGIGWNPAGTVMYLVDSGPGDVDAFDFDEESGEISARRTIIHIDDPGVVPDGLTVDEEGGIWVALWGGGSLRRYDPTGELTMTIDLPVERPTSCVFGGPDRRSLFVTTARVGLDELALGAQPHAGKVFCIDGLGVRGMPTLPYRGTIASP